MKRTFKVRVTYKRGEGYVERTWTTRKHSENEAREEARMAFELFDCHHGEYVNSTVEEVSK